MSLSLHSSRDALTSSKRGLEKDSDIEPLKSSIGEISSRISARPPTAAACSSGERVARHSGLPISQSKDAVCRASRSGTSSGSRILAKETRSGAPGIFCWSASPVRERRPGDRCFSVVLVGVLVGREPAKMRPSKDLTTCGRDCAGVVVGNGGAVHLVCPTFRRADQRGDRDRSRAPLVTRLGGQAVRGQRNRRPYPCSSALSTPGGWMRPDATPRGRRAGEQGLPGRALRP